MKKSKANGYVSIGHFDPEEVLPFVFPTKKREYDGKEIPIPAGEREYAGHKVRMTSTRYKLFATKGLVCAKCGTKGKYFSLEKHANDATGKYHFNLYAIKNGKPVMMTKDHIVPKSKGGSDKLENLQPMCIECNGKKADNLYLP